MDVCDLVMRKNIFKAFFDRILMVDWNTVKTFLCKWIAQCLQHQVHKSLLIPRVAAASFDPTPNLMHPSHCGPTELSVG